MSCSRVWFDNYIQEGIIIIKETSKLTLAVGKWETNLFLIITNESRV